MEKENQWVEPMISAERIDCWAVGDKLRRREMLMPEDDKAGPHTCGNFTLLLKPSSFSLSLLVNKRTGVGEKEAMYAVKVEQLKAFIGHCKSDPSLLRDPSMDFFRDYLESLGAHIPPHSAAASLELLDVGNHGIQKGHVKQESGDVPYADYGFRNKPKQELEDHEEEDEIVESDIEFEGAVVEPDSDPPQKMGDASVEVTEESRDAAQMLKAKAVDAISEGKLDEAVEHLTQAIVLNPTSAILYSARANVFVKMQKPNEAVRDSDAALEINPDSAKGYKSRGMAKVLLGKWEEAASDLHMASKLDHDEEIQSALKLVEPNVYKIEEHRRKYERLHKEREIQKAQRKQQCANAKADHESVAALRDGNVLSIHSLNELDMKLKAASKLSRLAILYFTATWCGPCRFMAPIYKNLAEKHPKVVFLKVDIDEAGEVAHRWNVNSVPTFFFIREGKEIDKAVGADKNGLERKIALHEPKS
ncbi:TPR repeat-containing thioredoxin TDX [Apostasia shenzhenica]|uniref:TPR repeat-containing thioredoxin TDX n=1 Tax=Apostasia shenzhenica TaxID=1088818 RepID=A0A2I0B4K4_9ASPA|nr:TPR repeat-containing thioredoxin TDX [Apostasia shenzhenica]